MDLKDMVVNIKADASQFHQTMDGVIAKAKQYKQLTVVGPMTHVYNFFGGLCEFWVFVFGTATIYLAATHKLTSDFAAAITAITGIMAIHDALDEYHQRQTMNNQTNVTVNVDSPQVPNP